MRRVEIGFWGTESILEFLKIMTNCQCEMELVGGNFRVDAKSLLAVLSLSMLRKAELVIHSGHCEGVLDKLECYIEQGRLMA